MVDMGDKWENIVHLSIGLIIGVVVTGIIVMSGDKQPEYALVEDNAVETIISIKQGDDLTLLNVNRYEDGGGLWEVTYDGKNEPKTRRVE